MAPCNGTQQWHHVHSCVVTLPPNYCTLQCHPTMAPSNGTKSTAPCNGTLVPRPIRQSGSSPSALLEVRTPIAIAIWGKKHKKTEKDLQNEFHQMVQLDSCCENPSVFQQKNKVFYNAAQVAESKKGRPPQSHGPLVENTIEVDRRCCLCFFTCSKSLNKVSFLIMYI